MKRSILCSSLLLVLSTALQFHTCLSLEKLITTTTTPNPNPTKYPVYLTGFVLNESILPIVFDEDYKDRTSKKYQELQNGLKDWCETTLKGNKEFKDILLDCDLDSLEKRDFFVHAKLTVDFDQDKIKLDPNSCLKFSTMTLLLKAITAGTATKFNLCFATDLSYPQDPQSPTWKVKIDGSVVDEQMAGVNYTEKFADKKSDEFKAAAKKLGAWTERVMTDFQQQVSVNSLNKNAVNQTSGDLDITLDSGKMPTKGHSRCITKQWSYFLLSVLRNNVTVSKDEFGLVDPFYGDVN